MRVFNNNLQFNNNSNNFVSHHILYRHNKHKCASENIVRKISALTVMEPIPASTHKHLILESIVYFSNYSMNKKDIINRLSSAEPKYLSSYLFCLLVVSEFLNIIERRSYSNIYPETNCKQSHSTHLHYFSLLVSLYIVMNILFTI